MNVNVAWAVFWICVAALIGGCMIRGHYQDQEYGRVGVECVKSGGQWSTDLNTAECQRPSGSDQ